MLICPLCLSRSLDPHRSPPSSVQLLWVGPQAPLIIRISSCHPPDKDGKLRLRGSKAQSHSKKERVLASHPASLVWSPHSEAHGGTVPVPACLTSQGLTVPRALYGAGGSHARTHLFGDTFSPLRPRGLSGFPCADGDPWPDFKKGWEMCPSPTLAPAQPCLEKP